jgi:transposase
MAEPRSVVVGVDTHADVHVAVALSDLGERLSSLSVPTTPSGFERLLHWAEALGEVPAFGIEGPGSFRATLARYIKERGHRVLEVSRPDRRTRRQEGRSDPPYLPRRGLSDRTPRPGRRINSLRTRLRGVRWARG